MNNIIKFIIIIHYIKHKNNLSYIYFYKSYYLKQIFQFYKLFKQNNTSIKQNYKFQFKNDIIFKIIFNQIMLYLQYGLYFLLVYYNYLKYFLYGNDT